MKRVLLLLVAVVMAFTLTACNSEKTLNCVDSEGTFEMEYIYTKDEIISVYVKMEFGGETLEETVTREDDLEAIEEAEDTMMNEADGENFYEIFEQVLDESEDEADISCTIK